MLPTEKLAIEYARPRARDPAASGRRLANVSYLCAIAASALIAISILGSMGFAAYVPTGQDSDQFDPTLLLTTFNSMQMLGLFAFPILLGGMIFAIVGLTQQRTIRTWLALLANVLIPAVLLGVVG